MSYKVAPHLQWVNEDCVAEYLSNVQHAAISSDESENLNVAALAQQKQSPN